MPTNHCSESYLVIVNGVRATMFIISFITCFAVFVGWIYTNCRSPDRKAMWTASSLFYTADRLPFYVLITAMIHSFVEMFQLVTLSYDYNNAVTVKLCISLAFFATWLDTSTFLVSIIAPTHLMLIHCKKTSEWLQDERKKRPRRLEVGYILTIVLGGLIVALVPFACVPFHETCYGFDPEGLWCWITSKDENCARIPGGLVLQILLWYAPGIVAVLFTVAAFVHLCTIHYKKRCLAFILRLLPDQENQGFTCPMITLMCYLLVFSIVNTTSFIIRADGITTREDAIIIGFNHSLWGLTASIAIGVLLCYQTRQTENDNADDYRDMSNFIEST